MASLVTPFDQLAISPAAKTASTTSEKGSLDVKSTALAAKAAPSIATPAIKIVPSLNDALTTVKIIVGKGDKKKEYIIYKEFAIYHSPMLKAAFTGSFIEGQTQTMTLDDVEPDDFGVVQGWLYTQTLQLTGHLASKNESRLFRIWVLADRLLMPKLQNEVVHNIFALPSRPFNHDFMTHGVTWIYKNTTKGSKLRALLVDRYAFENRAYAWIEHAGADELSPSFLFDVAMAYRKDGQDVRKLRSAGIRQAKQLKLQDYKVPEGTL